MFVKWLLSIYWLSALKYKQYLVISINLKSHIYVSQQINMKLIKWRFSSKPPYCRYLPVLDLTGMQSFLKDLYFSLPTNTIFNPVTLVSSKKPGVHKSSIFRGYPQAGSAILLRNPACIIAMKQHFRWNQQVCTISPLRGMMGCIVLGLFVHMTGWVSRAIYLFFIQSHISI